MKRPTLSRNDCRSRPATDDRSRDQSGTRLYQRRAASSDAYRSRTFSRTASRSRFPGFPYPPPPGVVNLMRSPGSKRALANLLEETLPQSSLTVSQPPVLAFRIRLSPRSPGYRPPRAGSALGRPRSPAGSESRPAPVRRLAHGSCVSSGVPNRYGSARLDLCSRSEREAEPVDLRA